MLRDFVRTYVKRTRPRAMPLAAMAMKTQTHSFHIFYAGMTAMGSSLRPLGRLGAPLLLYYLAKLQPYHPILRLKVK